ncbi:hypothetical protein M011DRAFT_524771 [Sporormia fimetaria CBS 119925]|uniref:histidine kinase n=1 Tax=Sporormia fimetaria CBS 119925 TaxID=1340428 RepID=A0A6A6VJY4_9PLEO|nr:hypothetical protein M011DRAFT_524771 [Sporormia fimetaria CBS 119925]
MGSRAEPPDIIIERESLCITGTEPDMVFQIGQPGFKEELLRLYTPAENNAAEQLVNLKAALRTVAPDDFWSVLAEGLAQIADAQYAFVSKRILVDDANIAVEMPPIGEPGACLMGTAFYVNDGLGFEKNMQNFKYHAWSCPCAYMRHDKILIIPGAMDKLIPTNPNNLVVPGEAYLGIPLFADGKCFAHFGVMWNPRGAARRVLGWGFLEMLLHSLEDIILDRLLKVENFPEAPAPVVSERPRVVAHQDITVGQSLKPYARSLSHELRTPMQGVIGMLDVMMASVKEIAELVQDPRLRKELEAFRENIETAQDSSRRAIEAADNVVHAYDMNMGVPETPESPSGDIAEDNVFLRDRRPEIVVTGNHMPLTQYRGTKRRREELGRIQGEAKPQARAHRAPRQRLRHSMSEEPPAHRLKSSSSLRSPEDVSVMSNTCSRGMPDSVYDSDTSTSPVFASEHSKAPGLRHTDLRELIRYVINDALKVGGRPESAIAEETDTGELIVVRTRGSDGQVSTKYIEWNVSPDIPDTMLIDEKDLAKTVSCVISNAIKFTDNGTIKVNASRSRQGRYINVHVKDTGSGIPPDFIPKLFTAFAREDNSTTRGSEGLGLGLMVARGLARKLGGDIQYLHSEVAGPAKGSEFKIYVPLTPGDICSRATSPFGSPTPSSKSGSSTDRATVAPSAVQRPSSPPSSAPSIGGRDSITPENVSPAPPLPPRRVPTLPQLNIPPSESPRALSPSRSVPKSRALGDAQFNVKLANRYPLNFLVVEDNKINRKLLVHMLSKLGYENIIEAYDGNNAVEQMRKERAPSDQIDVVLMDLWMPLLDGFQATEAILNMDLPKHPTILAVSADITAAALDRVDKVGMKGFLGKPFQIRDLEKLIVEYCASKHAGTA